MPDGPVCKACGEPVGPPEEDVLDPENDLNNEDAHIKIVRGEKGERLQCRKSGQMTKVVDPEDRGGEPKQGGGTGAPKEAENSTDDSKDQSGEQQPSPSQQPPTPPTPQQQEEGKVYDIDEEKGAMEVLEDVLANPAYQLNQEQIAEAKDWAEIYDGQLPPNQLEDVLKNMQGVAKQKAQLIRQKYEAKLNKWVRDQSEGESGPPIGAVAPPTPGGGGQQGMSRPQPSPSPQQSQQQSPEPEPQPEPSPQQDAESKSVVEEEKERRMSMRDHRGRRRQEMVDIFAKEAAEEVASEFGSRVTDGAGFFEVLLKAKAKKDPDWFFEKMEGFEFDMISEFMEPSDELSEAMGGGEDTAAVDKEIERALSEMDSGSSNTPPPDDTPQREPDQMQHHDTQPEPSPEPSPQQEPQKEVEEQKEQDGPHWKQEEKEEASEDDIFSEYADDLEMGG